MTIEAVAAAFSAHQNYKASIRSRMTLEAISDIAITLPLSLDARISSGFPVIFRLSSFPNSISGRNMRTTKFLESGAEDS